MIRTENPGGSVLPEKNAYEPQPQEKDSIEKDRIKGLRKLLMKKYECTIVTGRLAYPYIKKFADMVMAEYPKIKVDVVAIRNDFFGEMITVSGLLTGGDIIAQLKEHGHYKEVLLPRNVLKADEDIFLDDVKLTELEDALQVKCKIVQSSGRGMLMSMLGRKLKQ